MNTDRLHDTLLQFAARGMAAQEACDTVLFELEKQTKLLGAGAKKVRALRRQSEKAVKTATGPFKSRTAQMHERRTAAELCSDCGKEPLSPDSRRLGAKCLKKRRLYMAERNRKS
jgi:DNA repair exonuclease SbcCD ATPase subunit